MAHTATTARRLSETTLRNVFDGLDADGDGRLTKDDLRRVWRRDSERLSELFSKLDLARTGTLSFAEFLIAYDSMHEQVDTQADVQDETAMDRQLRQVFDYVDVDGDGMITVSELAMAANQVIGRSLTETELAPLHNMFGGSGGLTFNKFKTFLVGWAQGNATTTVNDADHGDEEEEEEFVQEVTDSQMLHIATDPPAKQLMHRPSFVRDNSKTIISSDDGDPELLMAKRELRVLNILLQEAREDQLHLQAECDELRFDHDQLVMLTTTLRSRVVSLETSSQQLKDQLQTQKLNFEIANQEAVTERLEKTRLQKEMRALQTECAELRAQVTIQDTSAGPVSPRTYARQQENAVRLSEAASNDLNDAHEEIAILKLECRQLKAQNAELVLRTEQSNSLSERLRQENEELRRNLQFLNDVVNHNALSSVADSEASNKEIDEANSSTAHSSRRHSLADELQADVAAQAAKAKLNINTAAAFLFDSEALANGPVNTSQAESDRGSESSGSVGPATELATPRKTAISPIHNQMLVYTSPKAGESAPELQTTPRSKQEDRQIPLLTSDVQRVSSYDSEPHSPSQEVAESRPMSKTAALFVRSSGGSPTFGFSTPELQRQQSLRSACVVLEKLLKDDTAKDAAAPLDINVTFRGDYLGVANDAALKAAIVQHGGSADEQVLFADSVRILREKILSFGGVRSTNEKRRVLILTSHAVYTIRPHGWRVSSRTALENLAGIRLTSKGAGLFVIQAREGGDCICRSARWLELVSAVRRAVYRSRKINLDADFKDNVRVRMDDGTTVILEVDVVTQAVSLRRLHPIAGPTT